LFTISAVSEETGYFDVTCGYLSGPGSFTNGEELIITFARTGDKGDTGAQGTAGVQGTTGTTGPAGPSNVIVATSDSSTTTLYPVMVDTVGANATPKVHDQSHTLSYDASKGILYTGTVSTESGYFNQKTIDDDTTAPANANGLLAGPITISDGTTYTVPTSTTVSFV
jgi:hypothetical protein